MGPPEVANYLPAGISRYTTLQSWINQWSVDKTLGNALLWLPKVEAPVLVLGGSADSGSPPAIFGQLYEAVETAPEEADRPGRRHPLLRGTARQAAPGLRGHGRMVTRQSRRKSRSRGDRMSLATEAVLAAEQTGEYAPIRLNHLAYVTHDTAATVQF